MLACGRMCQNHSKPLFTETESTVAFRTVHGHQRRTDPAVIVKSLHRRTVDSRAQLTEGKLGRCTSAQRLLLNEPAGRTMRRSCATRSSKDLSAA